MKLKTSIYALAIAMVLMACKGSEDKPTVQETQLKLLTKTWSLSEVTLDGVNKKTSSEYNNFKLTISGTYSASAPDAEYNYSVSGRPQLGSWPGSGKWEFSSSAPETQLVRDPGSSDELPLTYSLTNGQLQITFTYQGDGYASRTSIVNGQWVMTFN